MGEGAPCLSEVSKPGKEVKYSFGPGAKSLLGEVCRGPPDPFTEKRHLDHFPA